MLQKYYKGFFIEDAVGNNAFSYNERTLKEIFVPPLVEGTIDDVRAGEEVVFCEVSDGKEERSKGLKNFVHWKMNGKDIFIFDNHNHAFFFWMYGAGENKISPPEILVHVDQHRDMRNPPQSLEKKENGIDLEEVFDYTNHVLNVGNFIQPALSLNVFADVCLITGKEDFEKILPEKFVLDIDIDIFAEEMEYIDYHFKIERIKSYIARSNFITVATSPYFMDQNKAVAVIKELFC